MKRQFALIVALIALIYTVAFATVSSETARVRHAGNGTSYAVTFVFYDTDEITVIRTSAAGNDTTLTETTNYSVSGGSGSTGTVTTVTSYSDGYITIIRNEPMTQETDWQVNGNFNVETLEDNLDRSTMQAQRVNEKVDRSLKVSPAEAVTSIDFTVPVTASKVIGWDANGTALTLYSTTAYSGDADTLDTYNTELVDNAASAAYRVMVGNTSGVNNSWNVDAALLDGYNSQIANGTAASATYVAPIVNSLGFDKSYLLLQTISNIVTAVSTGNTALPYDDTIPQSSEGFEVLRATITPQSSTSNLVINAFVSVACSTAESISIALFQDATANALTASSFYCTTANKMISISLPYTMVSGTASATTFKVRVGAPDPGVTVTINGDSGARRFGGVANTSLIISEQR